MNKLNVAVIFGGRSVEHEVSIVTAHQMMETLAQRHAVTPIYVTRQGKWLTGPALDDIEVYRDERWDELGEPAWISPSSDGGRIVVAGGRLRGPRAIDVDVLVPAIHGTFGEDGTLQGLLELADVPYTGPGVAASAIGMDKAAMKAVFRAAGLPVVPDVLVESARVAEDAAQVATDVEGALDYPMFVKPVKAGSSVGIAGAKDRESLVSALEVARRYDRRILVEKAMQGCIEINCSVLGGGRSQPRASVCEQPVAWEEFLSFDDKYLRGGKGAKGAGMASLERQIPAPISEELTKQLQENALAAFRAIDAAGVARVDSFLDQSSGETWVMEINTTPGSFAFYLWEASGLKFPDLADELLQIAIDVHEEKSGLLFTFESGMLGSMSKGGQKSGG